MFLSSLTLCNTLISHAVGPAGLHPSAAPPVVITNSYFSTLHAKEMSGIVRDLSLACGEAGSVGVSELSVEGIAAA
jgi:hypothetical protein